MWWFCLHFSLSVLLIRGGRSEMILYNEWAVISILPVLKILLLSAVAADFCSYLDPVPVLTDNFKFIYACQIQILYCTVI